MFTNRRFRLLHVGLNLLIVISMVVGCAAPAVPTTTQTQTTSTTPAAERPPEAVEVQGTTPRPDFIPQDAELIIAPVPAPAAPGSEIYRTYGVPMSEIQGRLQSQGYVECPEEQVILQEDGIAFICPGIGADMPVAMTIFARAGVFALADGPQPGPADAGAVLYILVSATAVAITWVALSQLPRVLMARDPGLLPDVNIPDGIPAPPPHLQNHNRGPYTSKLKQLGWITIMSLWLASETGGPKPDWCGQREDGAILIYYAAAQIVTATGRVYKGIAAIVNTGGAHLSTILTGVTPPAEPGGLPDPKNSGGNDFSQFRLLPSDQCPPMPRVVTQ